MIKITLIAAIVFFILCVSLHFIAGCFNFKWRTYERVSKAGGFCAAISLILFAISTIILILIHTKL